MKRETQLERVSIPLQRELESADVPQPCDKGILKMALLLLFSNVE